MTLLGDFDDNSALQLLSRESGICAPDFFARWPLTLRMMVRLGAAKQRRTVAMIISG